MTATLSVAADHVTSIWLADVGDAANPAGTVGAIVSTTVTVTELEAWPPAPEQVNVYVLVAWMLVIASVPLSPRPALQPPDAVHEVALPEVH